MSGPIFRPFNKLDGKAFPIEPFPSFPGATRSPHLVGFWTLNDQRYGVVTDTSGNHNHFYMLLQPLLVLGTDGWAINSGGNDAGARISANPYDARYDIGAPGVSFIAAFQTRVTASPGATDQWVISKGIDGVNTGSIGLGLGVLDEAAGVPYFRYVLNNTNYFSSQWPTLTGSPWVANTIYHCVCVRDSMGSMGTPNQLYFYLDGVRDTGLNGVGYVAFAPTASADANMGIFDAGPLITGTDTNGSAASGYNLANLQLALLQPNIGLPGAGTPALMDALVAKMYADPTYILQEGDLP